MKNTKRNVVTATIAIVLAILMISSILFQSNITSVNAQTGTAQTVTSQTVGYTWAPGTDYGNLLQYEWPQQHGAQYPGGDGGTYFSPGPAPDSCNVKWQIRVQSVTPNFSPVSYITAFNGLVFQTTGSGNGGGVLAFDAFTGAFRWNSTSLPATGAFGSAWSTGPGGSTVYKISDTVMTAGPYGLDIATGNVIWNATPIVVNTPMGYTTARYNPTCSWPGGSHYDPVLKMMIAGGRGWNCSDPYHEPKLQWDNVNKYEFGTSDGLVGDGVVAVASITVYRGFNETTGALMWETNIEGAMGYSGVYYDGKFIHGSQSGGIVECLDALTGKILWTYNSGQWMAFWACAPAAAYGRIFYINDDQHLYCLDANTGKELWAYPMVIGYQSWPIVGDGKVYLQTQMSGSIDRLTGQVYNANVYSCIDAFTGELIWSTPYATGTFAGQCIAYGNLYLAPSSITGVTNMTNLWCISSTPNDWSNFRGDPAQTGKGNTAGPMALNEIWEYKTEGSIISSPVASNGKVYVGSCDKYLYCFDEWTGNLIWKALTGSRLCSAPAVVDGKIYTGPDDGYVHCFDAVTGQELWKADAGASVLTFDPTGNPIQSYTMAPIQSSPIVTGGRVYVGSLANMTYCFDATSGRLIWSYPMLNRVVSTPVVIGNDVYVVPASNGSIYKLTADTGTLQKIIWVPGTTGQNTTAVSTFFTSPTIIGNGRDRVIYIAAANTFWYAINETTGSLMWRWRYKESYATRNDYSVLYIDWMKALIIVDRFSVKALDTTNVTVFNSALNTAALNATVQYKAVEPNVLWSTYTAREVAATPVYASVGPRDGVVYVSTDSRIILAYNASNGRQVGVFDSADLDAGWSSPAIYDGFMFVGNNNMKLYAFRDPPKETLAIGLVLDNAYPNANQPVTIIGQVWPVVPNIPVNVSIGKPDGTRIDLPATSDNEGYFTVTYTPTTSGNFTVMGWWPGYKYYGASYSDLHYIIASPQPTQAPTQAPTEAPTQAPTEAPTATPAPGTSTTTYAIVAVIVIVIIAIAAYVVMRMRKKK